MRREWDARGVVRQVLELLLLWPQGGEGVGQGEVCGGGQERVWLLEKGKNQKTTGELLKNKQKGRHDGEQLEIACKSRKENRGMG